MSSPRGAGQPTVGDTPPPAESPPPVGPAPSAAPVHEPTAEIEQRVDLLTAGPRERMDALVRAVISVSSGIELDRTLRTIVRSAAGLVGARYGALIVLGRDGTVARFHCVGIDDASRERIGPIPTGQGLLGVDIDKLEPLRLTDLSADPRFVGFPPHHPPMRTFLGVPVHARDEVFGRLYVTEKEGGGEFTADDEAMLQALAAAAGVAIDNSRLYEQVRSRRRWLEAAGEVTASLLGGASTDDALRLIACHARDLADADYTVVALPEDPDATPDEQEHLRLAVCVGQDAPSIVGRTVPVTGSTTGSVFIDQTPRSVPNLALDLAAEFGPALALPLASGGAIAGVLLAIRAPDRPGFDDEDLEVVASFADQAALALQRAEAQAAQRELQMVADRDRIARDLHDQVIQRVFAIGLGLQSTHRRAGSAPIAARLADHIDQLDGVIQDIRAAIFDVRGDVTAPAGGGTRPSGSGPPRR